MGPGDQAIIAMHCPTWLVDWFWGSTKSKNLRQLVRGPLRGRARLAVAGDLHFFMRHSFRHYGQPGGPPSLSPSLAPSELSTPAGASPQGLSPTSSRPPTPTPSLRGYMSPSQLHQSLMARLTGSGGSSSRLAGSSPVGVAAAAPQQQQQQQQQHQQHQPLVQQTGWPGTKAGPAPAPGAGQQQSPALPQQQLVFGRAVDMDSLPGGASPSGGSPLGGSPSLPSMLLDSASPSSRQPPPAQLLGLEQQGSGRWTAAANLAGRVIGFGKAGAASSGGGSVAAAAAAGGGAGDLALGPEGSRAADAPAGHQGRPSSAPVPVGGRKKVTLPILSPVHGSQMELAEMEAAGSGEAVVPSSLAEAPTAAGPPPATLPGSSSAPALEQAAAGAAGAAALQPPEGGSAGRGSGGQPLKHHDSARAAMDAQRSASSGGSPPGSPPAGSSLTSSTPFSTWWPGLRGRASKPGAAEGGSSKRLDRQSSAGG